MTEQQEKAFTDWFAIHCDSNGYSDRYIEEIRDECKAGYLAALETAPPSVEALQKEVERLTHEISIREAEFCEVNGDNQALRTTNAAQAEQLAAMTEFANKWRQSAIEAMAEPQATVELTDVCAAIRRVLKHHKLTEFGDGVVEADIAHAVVSALNQRQAVKTEPDSGVYWRPIETVPVTKDEVLAYSKNGNQWMVNGLYLRSQMQEYPGFYTHWSPLPAGPDSEPKQEPLSAAQGVPEGREES
jgi:HAMP domain-containing protein